MTPRHLTVLIAAAEDAEQLKAILDESPDEINTMDFLGRLPIHAAAEAGNLDSLNLILELGQDPDAQDSHSGHRPLHEAVRADSLGCVEVLLQAGADPNLTNEFQQSAIFESKSVAVFQRLIDAGARSDLRTQHDESLLRYSALRVRSFEVLQRLLEMGFEVDEEDRTGRTALHGTIEFGLENDLELKTEQFRCFEILIQAGADINHRDGLGRTLLHTLAWSAFDDVEFVDSLLRRGADPNIPDSDNVTPLSVAASRDALECVQVMLKYGADPNRPNRYHRYPLDVCSRGSCVAKHLEPLTQRIPKPAVRMSEVLDRVLAISKYADCEPKGCTESEIQVLESQLETKLPDSYRLFLSKMGHGLGDFMVADHFHFQLEWVKEMHAKGYQQHFDYAKLPNDAIVFATRQYDWTVYFRAGARAKDPPVFAFEWEGDDKIVKPTKIARSITDFFDERVMDHERWFG